MLGWMLCDDEKVELPWHLISFICPFELVEALRLVQNTGGLRVRQRHSPRTRGR